MLRLVLATSNPHKVDELRTIFAQAGLAGVELLTLTQAAGDKPLREPAETGETFEENAAIKALSYAQQLNMWCLADDSGLEVDALGGRPGVISSHYGTEGLDTGLPREQRDPMNNRRVLDEMANVPLDRRSARFICVNVLARPSDRGEHAQIVARTQGLFEGCIGVEGPAAAGGVPRGAHGFGYDPIFLVAPELTKTAAELLPAEKNRRSHRATAASRMAEELRSLLANRR